MGRWPVMACLLAVRGKIKGHYALSAVAERYFFTDVISSQKRPAEEELCASFVGWRWRPCWRLRPPATVEAIRPVPMATVRRTPATTIQAATTIRAATTIT